MRPTYMPGRPRDGETGKQRGSTSRDSWRWSSISSSLTWSPWACIRMRAWADRSWVIDPRTHNKGEVHVSDNSTTGPTRLDAPETLKSGNGVDHPTTQFPPVPAASGGSGDEAPTRAF